MINSKYLKINKGFTLIEMIIYIALFSIMMGGLVVIVFQLIQSSEGLASKDTAQEEINFVLKKIDWALTGASDVEIVSGVLNITKNGNLIHIKLEDKKLKFCEGSCPLADDYFPLTTANVEVKNLSFTKLNTDPLGISIILNINGIENISTKYLRIQNP